MVVFMEDKSKKITEGTRERIFTFSCVCYAKCIKKVSEARQSKGTSEIQRDVTD